jgi:DNA polymerase elongation subunit (family B)
VKFIEKIAQEIETYVNDLSLEETQKLHYNSQEKDFAIIFETEKISLSAIFAAKARYATWDILKDGKWKDAMSITGLEIIRSDSPEIVKPMIKNILEMMLKDFPDEEIRNNIEDCKVKLKNCNPLEIAENKGINKIDKYSVDVDENKMEDSLNEDYQFKSGTPHQVKGTLNFNFLVDKFNLGNRYEIPTNGNKAKVVYLQKNPYKLASLSFIE